MWSRSRTPVADLAVHLPFFTPANSAVLHMVTLSKAWGIPGRTCSGRPAMCKCYEYFRGCQVCAIHWRGREPRLYHMRVTCSKFKRILGKYLGGREYTCEQLPAFRDCETCCIALLHRYHEPWNQTLACSYHRVPLLGFISGRRLLFALITAFESSSAPPLSRFYCQSDSAWSASQ